MAFRQTTVACEPEPPSASPLRGLTEPGLPIEALAPGERVLVRTTDADYDITAIAPNDRQVLISTAPAGDITTAWLDGSSENGVLVHPGQLAIGCCLEFRTSQGGMVTSPVCAIAIVKRG
jgi:hypothetical protein